MRCLLDTHIFYWAFYETDRLSKKALQLIEGAEEIFVSSASIWEIAIKVRLEKIKADPQELFLRLEESGFQELPVRARHAVLVANLPLFHGDPFDRILVAQAISEPLQLLTHDSALRQYSELVISV